MKNLLRFTSTIELTLGIALIIIPSSVLKLLFGSEPTHILDTLARFTGIVFVCLGIACFPSKDVTGEKNLSSAFKAMFSYNLLASVYLGYLKFADNFNGVLLLPAVILHSLITVYFAYVSLTREKLRK